uniref:Uncharacterized protein n=1 Tax=Anguilla anguilla TaxID=7936 RepID=A0A0E9X1P5_ANGAN
MKLKNGTSERSIILYRPKYKPVCNYFVHQFENDGLMLNARFNDPPPIYIFHFSIFFCSK